MSSQENVMSWRLLVAGAALLSAGLARGDAAETLRVMTYNVRYASDRQPNAWADRLPVAEKMLRRYEPDVIGMQEALFRQVKDFQRVLPEHRWIGLGRDGGSRGEFMAVFYRAARLEPLEFDHFWLSDTPETIGSSTWGNSNRRMVTWVRFRDLETGAEFYFWNTHFDHEIEEARRKSAQLMMLRIANLPDAPLIVTGDFNSPAEAGVVYETMVGEGRLVDSWTAAERRGEVIGTFNGFRGRPDNQRRIDWILTRGAVRTLSSEIITFADGGQYPSDHFPIVADVLIGR